jgi:hypothetical protein
MLLPAPLVSAKLAQTRQGFLPGQLLFKQCLRKEAIVRKVIVIALGTLLYAADAPDRLIPPNASTNFALKLATAERRR